MDIIKFDVKIDQEGFKKEIKKVTDNLIEKEEDKIQKEIDNKFLPEWIATNVYSTQQYINSELQQQIPDDYSSDTLNSISSAFEVDRGSGYILRVDLDKLRTIPNIYKLSNVIKSTRMGLRQFNSEDIYTEEAEIGLINENDPYSEEAYYEDGEIVDEDDINDDDFSFSGSRDALTDIYDICKDIVEQANTNTKARNSNMSKFMKKRIKSLF